MHTYGIPTLILLCCLTLLSACGGAREDVRADADAPLEPPAQSENTVTDPRGPIPAPSLPPGMAQAAAPAPAATSGEKTAVPYTISCLVIDRRGREFRERPKEGKQGDPAPSPGQDATGKEPPGADGPDAAASDTAASDTAASDTAAAAQESAAAGPAATDDSAAPGAAPPRQTPPGASGDAPAAPAAPAAADAEAQAQSDRIIGAFKGVSLLYQLQETPPESLTGLEQRLSAALDQGRQVLSSLGYFAGQVRGRIRRPRPPQNAAATQPPTDGAKTATAGAKAAAADAQAQGEAATRPVEARIIFIPGELYRVGKTVVRAAVPDETPKGAKALPRSLADVGLAPGAPAEASVVLAAVDRAHESFLNNGYPFAVVASTRYIVDHETRTLDAEVDITPGDFVRMGEIERHGAASVAPDFIANMRRWRVGRPWSKARVEAYQEALRQSGLFQSIVIAPGDKEDGQGNRAVVTTLESAPERTVGGALKYHSDFGPGIQAYWENRNLSGAGDRLRIEMPLWMDMQEITATYRRPFFLRRDQDFVANGGFLNQDTDAYAMTAASVAGGVERRFTRFWSGSVKASAEGGTIKEPHKLRRDYVMYGLPLGLNYDSTGSLLNAVKGQRLALSVIPYTGEYEGDFNVLRTRADAEAFFPLAGEDAFVLATRTSLGMVFGAGAQEIPPSARFYSGGGGSVRGYAYQSLGPRNSDDDPEGGNSLMEVSVEGRWKFTPEWGMVAFLDGGTVFDNAVGESADFFDEDIQWGAGVGLRYYTAIGPVRFDIATPLNPRDDDDRFQFYISIGQSF